MHEIYEGPVYLKRNSDNSYDGDETLYFPDGQQVKMSRDMHDTLGATVEWRIAQPRESVMEALAASTISGRGPGSEEVWYEECTDGSHFSNLRYGVDAIVVKAFASCRYFAKLDGLQQAIETTASPTTASRSKQIVEILTSR